MTLAFKRPDQAQPPGRARVLVLQNSAGSPIRRLGDWWAADGLDLEIIEAFDGGPVPESLADVDGLVLLGGDLMPDADDRAPWLPQERALARRALDHGTPLLGICFGAQLLAHIAGGEVTAQHGLPESGSTALTLRPEAADDQLLHGLPDVVPGLEHRVDAITALPPSAVWLAESQRCPYQAFRIGSSPAWGFQFHPEADAAGVRGWDRQRLQRQGFDPDEVVRRADADDPVSTPIWREVARRFGQVLRSG